MIRWGLYLPSMSLALILYFQYFNFIFKGRFSASKIEPELASIPRKFEYRYTIISLLIYALVGLILGFYIDQGNTKVYKGPIHGIPGFAYLVISLFSALGIHDLYFYFSHRLLHSKYFFKSVHSRHHRSQPANAWSAFSFHPIEAYLQIGIVPLVALVLPIHEYVFYLFVGFLLFIPVYGHSGYELRGGKAKFFSLFNTSLHHYQHHQFVNYNFGIYLNIWDKLFSTNYPGYDKTFRELSSRIKTGKLLRRSIHDRGTRP